MLYTPVVKNEKFNAYSTSPSGFGHSNKHTASVQHSAGGNHNSLLYQKSVNRTEQEHMNMRDSVKAESLLSTDRLHKILMNLSSPQSSRPMSRQEATNEKPEKVSISAGTQTGIQLIHEPQPFSTPRPLFVKSPVLTQSYAPPPNGSQTACKRTPKKMSIDGRKSPSNFCARRPGLYNPPKRIDSKRGSKRELFEVTDLDMKAKPRGNSSSNQTIPHASK